MTHAIVAGAFLVVGLDDGPRCIRRVRVKEHRFFRFGVIILLVQAGLINRAELPPLERIGFTGFEPRCLFVLGHREPVFVQPHTRARQHPFKLRRLAHLPATEAKSAPKVHLK